MTKGTSKTLLHIASAPLGLLLMLSIATGQASAQQRPSRDQRRDAQSRKSQDTLTPQQQEAQRKYQRFLRDMSPEDRKLILDNLSALQRLKPAERSRLLRNYQRWQSLPSARKDELRKNYLRLLQMDPKQRQRFFENYQRWQKLSPDQRNRLRNSLNRRNPAKKKPPSRN